MRRRYQGWGAAFVAAGALAAGLVPAAPPTPDPARSVEAAASVAAVSGPERSIVVRPRQIELVVGERVVRSIDRTSGPIGIERVVRLVGDRQWASINADVVTLYAGLAQVPDTHLVVAAPAVRVLRLAHRSTSTSALSGSNARVSFDRVRVVGWDADRGKPAAPGPRRGYVSYRNASEVDVRGSTFVQLGRPGYGVTGVTLSRASVTVRGSRFQGNDVGLAVLQPGALRLSKVTVTGSQASGLVIEKPRAARLERVTSSGNAGPGIEVTHRGRALTLTGAVLRDNDGAGVFLEGQQDVRLDQLVTSGNSGPAVHLKSVRDVTVSGLTSRGDVSGAVVGGTSAQVTLDGARVSGATTGVDTGSRTREVIVRNASVADVQEEAFDLSGAALRVEDVTAANALVGVNVGGSVEQAALRDVTVTRASTGLVVKKSVRRLRVVGLSVADADVGAAVAGQGVALRGGVLRDTKTGVKVYGSADGVTLTGTKLVDPGVGVLATSSTKRVTLRDVDIVQRTGIGIASTSAGLRVDGGSVAGGLVGIDLHGPSASVAGTTVQRVRDGIRLGRGSRVEVVGVRVDAQRTALRAGPDASARVVDSRLWAVAATDGPGEVALGGKNDLPPTPLPWYGVAALVAAASAIGLELLRRAREYEPEWVTAVAAHVTNRS